MTTSLRKRISITLMIVLATSILSGLNVARADELTDTKANLATATAKLASLQTALNDANSQINGATLKISGIDPSLEDSASVIAKFQTIIEAAKAAKAIIEPQISPVQTEITTLSARIAQLTAAQNAGLNCPTEWGLSSASFGNGIDAGTFTFDSKVLSEINKDSRIVVLNTTIQTTKDGSNWSTLTNLSNQSWINFANNSKATNSPQIIQFLSSPYQLLNVAGGRVKTTTSIAKEGCTPFTIESDAKNITNAAIIFTKTSPEELYQNYPQAIPNFQSRDSLISAVAQIKNDFVASAGSGNYYNYNRGFGSFAVVIAGRSSGCTGSVGNVLVGYGATCEIGIYWIYNNIYKLVDTVSTVGGQSEAAKQQAAMKVQATALSQAILRALDAVTPIMDQVNALNDKYSSNWNTAGQPAIDQYMSLYSQLNSLLATVVTTRDQANTILNSQYVNSEISQIAQNVMSLSSKFTGSFQSWMNQIKSSIANINSGLNQPSADASSAIVKAKSLLAAAARDQAVAQAKYQELMDQYSRKIWNGWSESSFLNTINDLDRMMSGYSNSISNSQSMLNQSVVAMKNARTQADVDAWNGAVNLYQQLSNIYNSSLGLLGKVSSLLKSQMKSGSTPESDAALQNADTFYKSALNALNDANSELNSYPIFLKSKGILTSGNTIYNQEITRLKNIIDKYNSATQEANALLAKSNYSLSVSGGLGSWAKVADLYRQSQSNFSTATNYYSKMLSIISSQNPSMTGDQSVDPFVDTNGVDEVTAGSISTKKDKQGRYLITVTSNQEDTDFIILAVKSGSKAIKFVATSDADGNIYLRTTRKLAGYVLQLMLDNEVISKTKKLA